MTAIQYKTLLKAGLNEDIVETLGEVFQNKEESLATKESVAHTEAMVLQKLKTTELKLQKEIEQTKLSLQKEIEQTKLSLQKEIKDVELKLTKEIKEVELQLTREIKNSERTITKRLTFFFGSIYLGLIVFLVKEIIEAR